MRMTRIEMLEKTTDNITDAVDGLHDIIEQMVDTPNADLVEDLVSMLRQTLEEASGKLREVKAELDVESEIKRREEEAYQNYEYERSVS